MLTENRIIQALKSFREIRPGDDFTRRSQAEILAVPPQTAKRSYIFNWNPWSSVKFASALVLATLLLFVVVGGLSYFNLDLAPSLLVNLDKESLLREANSLDWQIHLKELRYYDESAKTVAALLDQVSKNGNN